MAKKSAVNKNNRRIKLSEKFLKKRKELKKIIMVDHTFIFTPEYDAIKGIIRKNELGRVFNFYSFRGGFGEFQIDTNIFWHLMYHDLYLLNDLFPAFARCDCAFLCSPALPRRIARCIAVVRRDRVVHPARADRPSAEHGT